ncbi:MAG: hypothetical protein Q8R18_02405, partial [bacterium]|nr:hypothetical protein [bacterium]
LANIESLVGNRRQAMNVVQEGIEVYNGLNPKDPDSAALFKKFITLYYKEYRGKEERQKGKEYIEENIEWICRKDSSFWNEIFDTKIYGYDFSVAPESYGPFRKLMDIVPKLRNIYNREITFLYGEGSFKAILVKPDRNPQIEALEQERKERLKNITSNEEFEISSFKNFFNYNSFIFHIVQKIAKLVDKEEFRRNQRLVNELYNAQNIYNILNNEKIKTNNGAKLSSYEEVYDMNQLIANSAEKLEGILERCYEAVPRLDIWEESILQEYFLKRHQYTINHHPLSQIIENFRILKKECEEDYLKKKIELQKDDGKRVQERIDISNTKEIRKPFKNDSFKKFLDYNSFISNIVQEISIPRGKEEFRANPELVNNLYNAQDLYRNLNQRITETEDCTKFASSEEIDSMNQIFANAAEKLDEILENCYKAAPELKL